MPEKGTVVLPRSMAFNTYGSGNYEGIAQASEPLLKWLPGVKALQAVMSHDHGTPSFVVCMLRAGQDAYLRFIIAFAACWHVYLMMLSCFRDQKHVAVAAVECPAAKGTSWWLSSASATTKSSMMHGAMPDCFGSAARTRAGVVDMSTACNCCKAGVSKRQELKPMCILKDGDLTGQFLS